MYPDPNTPNIEESSRSHASRQVESSEQSPLTTAMLAVLKRPWIVIIIIVLITVPAVLYLFSQPLKYQSQSVVSTARPTTMGVLGLDPFANDRDEFYFLSILESNAFYDRIAKDILESIPALEPDSIRVLVRNSVSYTKRPRAVGFFAISATANSAEFAQKLAETALTAFQDITVDLRRHESNLTAGFIENQIEKLNTNLGETESQIQAFLEKRGMGIGDVSEGIDAGLRSLQKNLIDAQTSRDRAKLRVDTYTAQLRERVSEYLSTNTNQAENTRFVDLNQELDRLTKLASDSLVQLDTTKFFHIQQDRKKILGDISSIIRGETKTGTNDNSRVSAKGLEEVLQQAFLEYETSQIDYNFFRRELDTFVANNPDLPKDMLEFLSLTRTKFVLQKTMDILVEMREKTNIQIASETGGIEVIDSPNLPDRPVSQRRAMKALAALIFALFAGVTICFLLDQLDNSIQSESDLQKRFNLPVYGSVPVLGADTHKQSRHHHRRGMVDASDAKSTDYRRLDLYSESSPVSEAYHSIMTGIRFTARDRGMKTFVLTSPVSSDGKSLTTYNLGVSLARSGSNVLVIDADLRKSNQHNLFEVFREPGLTDCLNGDAKATDCIQKSRVPRLSLLPAGVKAANPAALLSSHLIKDFLKEIEQNYDIVLIDTPPITPCMDSRHLSLLCGGMILVVRAEQTKINVIDHCLDLIDRANTEVLGAIVNHAAFRYGYGYYYLYQRYNPYGYYYSGYQYYYHQDPDTGEKVKTKKRKKHSKANESRL